MATTKIATESARPSLAQNIEELYNSLHVGGAYDAKDDIVTDGARNQLVDGLQERTHTVKGFKTKMLEGQSEMKMVNDGVTTTRMLESVYGPHSTKKYWSM